MSQYVSELNEAGFEDAIVQADKPVLVDFWAPWCGPCRAMGPAVDAVAKKFSGKATVVKVNVDENPAVSARYNVRGIPTLVLFREGKESGRLVGLQSESQIATLIGDAAGVDPASPKN
jgi:thioredoxin 1